ncbi:hypothetical protein [Crenobacter caeni]|uniref:hypothetical protein n=1 Tax=Crenobacter caeni TaxID=2705474 RepID=UPI0013D78560|nr:hypothetical protein [Crenobacter caeni]
MARKRPCLMGDDGFRRGQVNHCAWRYVIGGGNWNEGVRNGARTLNFNANPWNANGNIGVRGVSDASGDWTRARRVIAGTQNPNGSASITRPQGRT